MTLLEFIALLLVAMLFAYLGAALFKPEWFQ